MIVKLRNLNKEYSGNHSPLEGESRKQGQSPKLTRWGAINIFQDSSLVKIKSFIQGIKPLTQSSFVLRTRFLGLSLKGRVSPRQTYKKYQLKNLLKTLRSPVLIMTLIFLSSCSSTTSSSWDCERQKGVGCINIGKADNSHNAGINSNGNYSNSNKCDKACKKRKKQLIKNLKTPLSPSATIPPRRGGLGKVYSPSLRSSEKVSRVLFSSYIDEQGNNHDESMVYYVDEQSSWIR